MKKQVLKLFSLLSLSVMLAVVAVYANPLRPSKATIPFDFSVGDKTLLAGVYTIVPTTTPGLLRIRREDGQAVVMVITYGVQAQQSQSQSKLVFHRYGDRYFLAQVWTAGDNDGRELLKSRTERELVKSSSNHLAKQAVKPEVVRIIAK